MYIEPIETYSPIFNSQLKNLYKKGKIKVKYGIYGEKLTKENVSDEHVICKCFGGSNNQSNIVLASKELNNARGNKPIALFVTMEKLRQYWEQFRGVKCQDFNGDEYIKQIKKTFKELINDWMV